jgi:ATP-dependent RNA circularization protein (DNA/RNA ligase family)
MIVFKKYPKIYRVGKEETDGILNGICHIEEKIDGANASIWMKDGQIIVASRNTVLTKGVDIHEEENTFNGLIDYVKENNSIRELLKDNPTYRLYGEWLVRHTIHYNETAYKKFYLFDISIVVSGDDKEEFLTKEKVMEIADKYGIPRPKYHGSFDMPTIDFLKEFVGKSDLGERGEGVVIRNNNFINNFGDLSYAKIVHDSFMEDNAITFGGNNKHSETYYEMYVVNKYITLARVQKIMNKIQPEIDKRLDLEHIPRISNSVYHDMLTEEIWDIQKNVHSLNFRSLRTLSVKKSIQIYKDILLGSISVADNG